ncbi:MAG: LEA type 2 family protein, partial [Treponema sp.]|nr:LEA type 2 family protein [Treponema sp.]
KVDWELFINTASFIAGTLKNDKTISKQDTVTLDIPLSFTYEGLYRSISSLIKTHEAAYNIALGISFPLPVIESKIYKLDFSGVIPLPRLPKLSTGSVRISKIDFSGVELSCGINVENPNDFSIPFPTMNWDYDVNGVPVVRSSFSAAGEIAAGAAGVALITVGVAYADIFKAVDSARNAGEAKGNLSLNTGIPIPALESERSFLDIPVTIPILQMPEISFQGITRKSMGTTLEFILNWEVNNKNNFNFNVAEFAYDFSVNSNAWARGSMNSAPEIKAAGKTLIPLTVSISALSMVRELVDIIGRGASVNYSCGGNMALTSGLPGLDKINVPLNFQGNTRIQ